MKRFIKGLFSLKFFLCLGKSETDSKTNYLRTISKSCE